MVIIVRPYGNHSNRLFQNLHIEAFCIENNIPFFNATLYGMAHLFKFHYNYPLAIIISFLFKIFFLFHISNLRFIRYVEFSDPSKIENYKDILLMGQKKLIFVGGWCFRVHDLVQKHSDLLREKYSIAKQSKNFSYICNKIKGYDVVLGVHIRRKDFKKWMGGKYYFNDATYNRLINEFISLHKGKKIFVIFFSDEKLDPSSLSCPVDYLISKNKYYIDYQIMGKCNYLIGPVSTFTIWVSFIYGTPYIHIENMDQKIKLEDFRINIAG